MLGNVRVLSVDPGGTTGWVILDISMQAIFLDTGVNDMQVMSHGATTIGKEDWRTLILHWRDMDIDAVFMESVIAHGLINDGKLAQIAAADRVETFAHNDGAVMYHVQPSTTKQLQKIVDIPAMIRGPHARDAYLIAYAGVLREADRWKKLP